MELVCDWMTTPAIVASEAMTLPAARSMMQKEQIRRLPVVNSRGELVGIVTEGDINRISASPATDVREYNLYHRIADLPLRDVMTRAVITVTPDAPIVTVAMILRDRRIGGVPVLDEGQIVGMITENDLFEVLIAEQQAHLVMTLGASQALFAARDSRR